MQAPPGTLTAPPQVSAPTGSGQAAGTPALSYRRLLRWSWVVVRDAWGTFLLGTGLALLLQTLAMYSVQVLSVVLSGLGGGGGGKGPDGLLGALVPGSLTAAGMLFAVLLFAQIALSLASRLVGTLGDNRMTSRLQARLHDKLLALGPDYHSRHDVGGTQLVVSNFALGSQMLLKDLIAFPLLRGVGLVTALVLLIANVQSIGGAPAWMSMLLVAMVVALPVGSWWLSRRVRRAYEAARDMQRVASEELLNSLSQPAEVQVLRAEAARSRSYRAALDRLLRVRVRASMRNELASQFQHATPEVLRAVFIVYAVFFALRSGGDPASVGPIVAIFFFVPEAVRPLQDILQFFMGLSATWPQIQSVVEVLETEPSVKDLPGATEAPSGLQPLALEGATFSYAPGGRRILDGLTHTFEPGGVTAVVARSGGGKSTLFNVLCRLQDPQAGTVRFAGQDVRTLRLTSLRSRVAKVSQFPLLIASTVRENFLLADATAPDERIRAACRRTGLWSELERIDGRPADPLDYVLPRSWDQGPSGGQRRLLAITRALLATPSVLLLDEPTTGIDAVWRDRLVGIVREMAGEVTVILVDHNVRDFVSRVADRVCVLEEGRFTQVGSPDELARVPGLFQTLLHQVEAAPGPGAASQAQEGGR